MGNVFNWLFRESGKCFKPDSQGEWEMFLTGYSGRVGNVFNWLFRENGKCFKPGIQKEWEMEKV